MARQSPFSLFPTFRVPKPVGRDAHNAGMATMEALADAAAEWVANGPTRRRVPRRIPSLRGGVPFSLKTGPVFPQYMYLTLYQGVFLVFVAVLRRSTTYQRCVVYYTEDALIRVDTRVIRE